MAQPQITGFEELAKQSALYPQESLLAVKKDQNSLHIGLPREVSLQEKPHCPYTGCGRYPGQERA
jgi:alanine dehydrogenase